MKRAARCQRWRVCVALTWRCAVTGTQRAAGQAPPLCSQGCRVRGGGSRGRLLLTGSTLKQILYEECKNKACCLPLTQILNLFWTLLLGECPYWRGLGSCVTFVIVFCVPQPLSSWEYCFSEAQFHNWWHVSNVMFPKIFLLPYAASLSALESITPVSCVSVLSQWLKKPNNFEKYGREK